MQTMMETWERENPHLEWQSCEKRTYQALECSAEHHHTEQLRVGILRVAQDVIV